MGFKIPYRKAPAKVAASVALVGLLGSGAATMYLDKVEQWEGYVPQGYLDPVGIKTKCWGDTRNVEMRPYSFEECAKSLNTHAYEIARPVMKCLPELSEQSDEVKAAVLSMAYNIGPTAFCKSSVKRRMQSGHWRSGCKRMAEIYTTARGVKLPGLVKRRQDESRMCLRGVRK